MKFPAQIELLQRFARISGSAKRPVVSEEVAEAQGVKANTASLNNGFFVDSGWLQRAGRGQYVATDPLLTYSQRVQFDEANARAAAFLLAETAMETWYWTALRQHLESSRLPRNEALIILARAAGAGKEYKVQLDNLLSWLEYIGLVRLEGDSVLAGTMAQTAQAEQPDEEEANSMRTDPVAAVKQQAEPARTGSQTPREDLVLAFNVELKLTTEELSSLDPEQIRALFEAVGTVAALTNRR